MYDVWYDLVALSTETTPENPWAGKVAFFWAGKPTSRNTEHCETAGTGHPQSVVTQQGSIPPVW